MSSNCTLYLGTAYFVVPLPYLTTDYTNLPKIEWVAWQSIKRFWLWMTTFEMFQLRSNILINIHAKSPIDWLTDWLTMTNLSLAIFREIGEMEKLSFGYVSSFMSKHSYKQPWIIFGEEVNLLRITGGYLFRYVLVLVRKLMVDICIYIRLTILYITN